MPSKFTGFLSVFFPIWLLSIFLIPMTADAAVGRSKKGRKSSTRRNNAKRRVDHRGMLACPPGLLTLAPSLERYFAAADAGHAEYASLDECLQLLSEVRDQAERDSSLWEVVYWGSSDLLRRLEENLQKPAPAAVTASTATTTAPVPRGDLLATYGYAFLKAHALRTQAFEHRDHFFLSGSPPLEGKIRMTSCYGMREHPVTHRHEYHYGIDLGFSEGARVLSTGAGRVQFAGKLGHYGNMVEILHPNGFRTRYAHLSRIEVAWGDTVSAGTVLGIPGMTGRATGPHLHWEIRFSGSGVVDPAMVLAFEGTLPWLGDEDILGETFMGVGGPDTARAEAHAQGLLAALRVRVDRPLVVHDHPAGACHSIQLLGGCLGSGDLDAASTAARFTASET